MLQTKKENIESLLIQAEINQTLINKIRKVWATTSDHAMRKEKMEHLVTTGKNNEKQRKKMLNGLSKSMGTENISH